MLELIEAIRFLTVIPINIPFNESSLKKSPRIFPLVGLLIGAISSLSFFITSKILPIEISSFITIFIWESISGGIHLDGFADTLDGLMSRKDREGILEIMRDSRIGVFGAVGIFFILGLKFLAINNSATPILSLLISPIIGRFLLTVSIYFFPYARTTGKGGIFSGTVKPEDLFLSLVITILLSTIIGGLKGLLTLVVAVIICFIFGVYLTRRIGGLTGDNYGAICELGEVIPLLIL